PTTPPPPAAAATQHVARRASRAAAQSQDRSRMARTAVPSEPGPAGTLPSCITSRDTSSRRLDRPWPPPCVHASSLDSLFGQSAPSGLQSRKTPPKFLLRVPHRPSDEREMLHRAPGRKDMGHLSREDHERVAGPSFAAS